MALSFPQFDPVALQIGPLAVRWYALAYLAGIIGGWHYAMAIAKRLGGAVTPDHIDRAITWITFGIILGGRLGYVLFYKPEFYFANPGEIVKIWHGGMSFHGGMLGVILAIILYCRKYRLDMWRLLDIAAIVTPIGLFFGRIANFINGELYGRVTDAAIGMVFPNGGPEPRHPSQLYEAAGEGLLLFLILNYLLYRTKASQHPGKISGWFLTIYGAVRFIIEFFREPDDFLGLYGNLLSHGQLLCLPMIALGIYLIRRKSKP